MLLGIPGALFELEEKIFTFKLLQDFQIENVALTVEAAQCLFEPLI